MEYTLILWFLFLVFGASVITWKAWQHIQSMRNVKLPLDSWYTPGKEVCVVMALTSNLDAWLGPCVLMNEYFAYQAGYGFLIGRIPLRPERKQSVTWDRTTLIRTASQLPYEYIFYIDADAIITKEYLELDSTFKTLIRLMLPESRHRFGLFRDPPNASRSCNGVILIRNTTESQQIVQEWDEKSLPPSFHTTEQDVFHALERREQSSVHLSPLSLGGFWFSKYVRHYMAGPIPKPLRLVSLCLMQLLLWRQWAYYRIRMLARAPPQRSVVKSEDLLQYRVGAC